MNSARPGEFPVWRAPVEEYPELLVGRSSRFRGGVRALRLLVLGGWLGVTLLAFLVPGLSFAYLVAYPVLLVFSAWALGVGYGITLFALSSLVVVALAVGQAMGLVARAGPGSVTSSAVTLLLVMAVAMVMTLILLRAFLERYAEMRQLHNQNQLDLQAARARETDLRLLADHLPGLVFECDVQGRCVFVNQRLALFFGKPAQVLLGTPMVELLGGGTVRDFSVYQSMVLRGDVVEFGMRRLAPDGVWCAVEVTLVPRQAADSARVVGWYGMIYDVTRREKVALELRDKATHDALTGLPNRLLFHERLEHAIHHAFRRKKSVAVMFIDLDNFKRINDVMGHAAGDLFLREVARRITGAIRGIDTVARLGGDEFVVLAEEVDSPETAALIADKVLEALLLPVTIGREAVSAGGSIGIAMGPKDGDTGEALLQAADAALYEAKAAGRKCYRMFNAGLGVAPETSGFSRPAAL